MRITSMCLWLYIILTMRVAEVARVLLPILTLLPHLWIWQQTMPVRQIA